MPNTNKHESPKPRIAEDGEHIVVNGVRMRRGDKVAYDIAAGRLIFRS